MAVTVIGAGPAGTSAALAALEQGAEVDLFDKSIFPRHKVCGEFLSPEAVSLLKRFGVWEECELQNPATLRSVFLSIGKQTKQWSLPEPARGLSRFQLDRILLDQAIRRGARFHREALSPRDGAVVAYGRHSQQKVGKRLFGFKAHFTGAVSDVMSLYFFDGAYVGINGIENGLVNVCGLAPEALLKAVRFQIDDLLHRHHAAADRLCRLRRSMEWLITGPLVFGPSPQPEHCYPAGDSAAFIDPFTGSGMLSALTTGILAGRAAASHDLPAAYLKKTMAVLQKQQYAAKLLRRAIDSGWAERLLPWVPGPLMFHTTRPQRLSV